MAEYTNYINYIKSIKNELMLTSQFKNNYYYNEIVEHVPLILGQQYLDLIQSEFNISDNDINEFVNKNDKIGNPIRTHYITKQHEYILCSPTSLRYIYHALLILARYKNTGCTQMVEIGGGYGGLLLAMDFFSKKLGIIIESYNIIDLPDVIGLINNYINHHKLSIKYHTYSADNFGGDINLDNLYLISNYCFTEISEDYRQKYIDILFPKISHGFIIWQNKVDLLYDIKFIKYIIQEKPQTGYNMDYNYIVFF